MYVLMNEGNSLIQIVPCCGQIVLGPGEKSPEDPEFWGPTLWKIIYFLAYKVNSKELIQKLLFLLNNLDRVLPCSYCNNHVNQYITREPLLKIDPNIIYSEEEIQIIKIRIFLWIRKLQNIIRFNNKKELYTFTLESLEEYYKTTIITQNTFRSLVSIFAFANNSVQRTLPKERKDWLAKLEELRMELIG
jgi:hypothetical protein